MAEILRINILPVGQELVMEMAYDMAIVLLELAQDTVAVVLVTFVTTTSSGARGTSYNKIIMIITVNSAVPTLQQYSH